MKKFVTFGEPMVMFVAQQEGNLAEQKYFKKFMAGAEVNVAIGMSRLGYDTYFASRVGFDSFGQFIINTLQTENIKTGHIIVDKNWPTGFQVKSRVSIGDPDVEYYRQYSAFCQQSEQDIDDNWIKNGDHIHITGIPFALSENTRRYSLAIMKKARKNGTPISFDPNLRPVLWNSKEEMCHTVNQAAMFADYVLPSIDEGIVLTGETEMSKIADFYLKNGVKCVVIKLGSKGAYYREKDGNEGVIRGVKDIPVIDTVGAGDGFDVGVISALLEGSSIEEALQRGNTIGALVIQSFGDNEGLPFRQNLEHHIREYY